MQYRVLDGNGDYTVGIPFYINSPDCVAQAVLTRLRLWKGEWFLDTSDGTPYLQNILGRQFGVSADAYIKQRILGTTGVTSIVSYSSIFTGSNRSLLVQTTFNTLYGAASISTTL